jgi:hypothetical protein
VLLIPGFYIAVTIILSSSNKHITNKHAATLARVDIHRQDDGDSYVEAWDQQHDIVVMEELSHDIYEEVQIEQIV